MQQRIALSVDDAAGRGRATAARWHVLNSRIDAKRCPSLRNLSGGDIGRTDNLRARRNVGSFQP
jgi:hypothetical protein